MQPPPFKRSQTSIRTVLWIGGLLALLAGTVFWALPARPYEAPWAWISFIGMCILEDYLTGAPREAVWSRLPSITLLAAIIVFRRHPEITMLVALTAAPAGALLKGQRASAWITASAHWMLAVVIGAAAFRAVTFEDTPHFVAATIVLAVVYSLLGPMMSTWLEGAGQTLTREISSKYGFALAFQLIGIFLAVAWRTAALQPAALKLADGALVGVAGIALGTLLNGRPAWLFRTAGRIPSKPALLAAGLLLLGLLLPAPLSWMLPLGLAVAAGVWAASRMAFAIVCGALGAFCNELVRGLNGGFMPVEGAGLMSGLGAANTYVRAGSHTTLPWLDDRLYLPPPFPGIASVGDILIALGMAWLVATLVVGRRIAASALEDEDDIPLDAAA